MLIRLDDRLDDLDAKLHSLDKTTDLQRVSLEEHIRRTNLLEIALSETNKSIQPIQEHVHSVTKITTFVFKFVSGAAVLVGIWTAFK